jgi:hypothetical protein
LLLKNRNYSLVVSANGYKSYNEVFFTGENIQINKTIILDKPDQSNAIQFISGNEDEIYDITKLIKTGDIIYEYNGVRIKNVGDLIKAQKECNQEKVTIKFMRDKIPMALMIPAYQIHGLVDNYFEDKEGLLAH